METDIHRTGPQGDKSKHSHNENHGEDARTGMGGSASGAPKPSSENQSHDKHSGPHSK